MIAGQDSTFLDELWGVHLQWFADPAEPEADADSDPDTDSDPDPDNVPEDRDYPIEFVVEDDPEPPSEADEEEAKQARLLAQVQQMVQQGQGQGQAQAQSDRLAEVLEQLGQTLQKPKEAEGQGQQQPEPWNPDELRKQYDEETFYKDPAGAVISILEQWTKKQVAPAYGQLYNQLQGLLPEVGKMKLAQNENYRMVLDNWGGEVDEEVGRLTKQLGASPDHLQAAIERVSGRHMAEIFAKQQEEKETQQPARQKRRASGTSPTTPGTQPPPGQGKDTKARITRSQMESVRKWASTKPISVESALELWWENGKKFPF